MRTRIQVLVVALLLVGGAPLAFGQQATLSGQVRDAGSRVPLVQASIVLQGETGNTTGAATDTTGVFTFRSVAAGRYYVRVSHIGYVPFTDTLDVGAGESRRLDVALRPEIYEVEEITVGADRGGDAVLSSAGLTRIDPEALGRLPTPGLSPDLSSYLLTLPGVFAAADRGGQLYIRGGTPSQNLVLIDGMPLYQPFHVVGFYSAFPADIIANADVYAGGFGARYGGRISSVIDVSTRNGNKDRIAGSASLAPFLTSMRLEGPLVPGKVSFLLSGRESMIDRIAPFALGESMPFRFGDYFGKFHAFLTETSSFSATAIRTHDSGDLRTSSSRSHSTEWNNAAYGLRYTFLPADEAVMTQAAVYLSHLDSHNETTDAPERQALVDGVHADILFSYLLGASRLDLGLFARSYWFSYDLGYGREEDDVVEGGGYIDLRFQVTPSFRIEPGIRIHDFSYGIGLSAEPRLRLTFRDGNSVYSAAWGQYRQQIMGLSSPRDPAETFTAWSVAPRYQRVPAATHYIASWRGRLAPGVDFSVEGYYKDLQHQAFSSYTGEVEKAIQTERLSGKAQGLDFRLELSRSWFMGFLGYGLASVKYRTKDGGQITDGYRYELPRAPEFYPPHDRRHQLTALGSFTFGAFRLNLQWQLGTGTPFTRIYGFYNAIPRGTPVGAIEEDPGQMVVAYAQPYQGRLPAYHRLDVSVERTIRFAGRPLTLQAGLVNAYGRRNLFNYDLYTGEHVYQLPLIPSVAIRFDV